MHPGTVALTLATSVVSAAMTYVVNLANAMTTAPRPLTFKQVAALAGIWLCGVAFVAFQLVTAPPGDTTALLLWNAPAILLLVLVALSGFASRLAQVGFIRRYLAARRAAAEQAAMAAVWQQHGRRDRFDLRVELGLAGAYADAQQVARQGVQWRVVFRVDGAPHGVTVRSFARAAGADRPVSSFELRRHARAVLDMLETRIAGGWRPAPDELLFVDLAAAG